MKIPREKLGMPARNRISFRNYDYHNFNVIPGFQRGILLIVSNIFFTKKEDPFYCEEQVAEKLGMTGKNRILRDIGSDSYRITIAIRIIKK